jgi:hypothetical protein
MALPATCKGMKEVRSRGIDPAEVAVQNGAENPRKF